MCIMYIGEQDIYEEEEEDDEDEFDDEDEEYMMNMMIGSYGEGAGENGLYTGSNGEAFYH